MHFFMEMKPPTATAQEHSVKVIKNRYNSLAMDKAMECERFFDGDWIAVLTTIDGKWLKNRLREEVQDQ